MRALDAGSRMRRLGRQRRKSLALLAVALIASGVGLLAYATHTLRRTELQTVKEASGLILNRLEERRATRDVEVESQKKVLAIESEKARTELEAQKRSLSERQAKLGGVERELASKEATYRDREASLDARAANSPRPALA